MARVKPDEATANFGEGLEVEQRRKEEEQRILQEAVNHFLKNGKKIEVLPPQEVKTRTLIGGKEHWNTYEAVEEPFRKD
jgi:hypothetical protein